MRIHLSEEENIVLSAAAVRRLIASGSSDAALLYLTLLLHHGSLSPEKLAGELRWSEERLRQAESALLASGLVNSHRPAAAEPEGGERPEYTREDVGRQLESDRPKVAQLTGNFMSGCWGKEAVHTGFTYSAGLYDIWAALRRDLSAGQSLQPSGSERYGQGRRPTLARSSRSYAWPECV